jgi:hypothetical protein
MTSDPPPCAPYRTIARTLASVLARRSSVAGTLLVFLVAGCGDLTTGLIGAGTSTTSPNAGAGGGAGAGAGAGAGGGTGAGTGAGAGAGAGLADAGAVVDQGPGTVTLHRLNQAEYNNTVRDLLGTTLTPADTFPPDGISDGFDNNASALTLSTDALRVIESAAETLAAQATDPKGTALQRLAPCTGANVQSCIDSFVRTFGLRAWRRPLTAGEVTAMVALAQAGVQQYKETYAQQVERAVIAFLTSPHFLFRVELDPDPTSTAAHPLGAYELASRVSYFLWSSTPDDTLLGAATDASLLTDAGLATQLARMLGDGRAQALAQNFAGQWLELRQAAAFIPDATVFPAWNTALRDDMLQQTKLTFADLLQGTSSLGDLFVSGSAYLNDRLATFYGLTPPGSSVLQRVAVPAGPRRGLLAQGAILSATSFPVRTSLVRRGQFVQEQLFCANVPPPPPNVPGLPPANASGSQRQRLEAHVTSAVCAGCHDAMDPYGFVLEQFDAIGALRAFDGTVPIDPSATLPDGTHVSDVQDLQKHMATDAQVPNCFVEKMATYALGRSLDSNDSVGLGALQDAFVKSGQHVDQAIRQIAVSPMFRTRHGGV